MLGPRVGLGSGKGVSMAARRPGFDLIHTGDGSPHHLRGQKGAAQPRWFWACKVL